MSERPKIDEIDVKILKTLLINARTPYAEIAKKCGISSNSVRLRYEKMKKCGVITGSITQINPKALGYNYAGYIMIRTEATKKQNTYEYLTKTPQVVHTTQLMGRYNVMVIVALEEIEELDEILSYIKRNPHVVNADFALAWDLANVDHDQNLEIKGEK